MSKFNFKGHLDSRSPENVELKLTINTSGLEVYGFTWESAVPARLPSSGGIYLLEADNECYVGRSNDPSSRLATHKSNKKINFKRCFILTMKESDHRMQPCLEYMEAYAYESLVDRGYKLDNKTKLYPKDVPLDSDLKEDGRAWVIQFIDLLPILGFRFVPNILPNLNLTAPAVQVPVVPDIIPTPNSNVANSGTPEDTPVTKSSTNDSVINGLLKPKSAGTAGVGSASPDSHVNSAGSSPNPKVLKLKGFVFKGVSFECITARGTLLEFLKHMNKEFPDFFEKVNELDKHGKERRYLAKSVAELYPSGLVQESVEVISGWFVDVNISGPTARSRITWMLESVMPELIADFSFIEK